MLTSSHGNRVHYRTCTDQSWKPAPAADAKVRTDGGRIRRRPLYAAPREDMFHVLRHAYASVQLEAGESIVSLSKWLGHSTPKVALDHYAHFMPGAGRRGLAAMDSWLGQDQPQIVLEKSLLTGWIKKLTPNPQVKELIASGTTMNVKYKETARGPRGEHHRVLTV
ncbi:hypothetical protein ACGFY7_34695 [Streptomyces prunicolor]|uniref:hypothetical protein n=1 Tax=Streptomyces prunicolor TaxID=67348 RepID=UPI0037175DEB